jgi:hypothetical protein
LFCCVADNQGGPLLPDAVGRQSEQRDSITIGRCNTNTPTTNDVMEAKPKHAKNHLETYRKIHVSKESKRQ